MNSVPAFTLTEVLAPKSALPVPAVALSMMLKVAELTLIVAAPAPPEENDPILVSADAALSARFAVPPLPATMPLKVAVLEVANETNASFQSLRAPVPLTLRVVSWLPLSTSEPPLILIDPVLVKCGALPISCNVAPLGMVMPLLVVPLLELKVSARPVPKIKLPPLQLARVPGPNVASPLKTIAPPVPSVMLVPAKVC